MLLHTPVARLNITANNSLALDQSARAAPVGGGGLFKGRDL